MSIRKLSIYFHQWRGYVSGGLGHYFSQ